MPTFSPFFVRACYAYEPAEISLLHGVLSFGKNELAVVHQVHPSGWAKCKLLASGMEGWIPTNYCAIYKPKPMVSLLSNILAFDHSLQLARHSGFSLFDERLTKPIIQSVSTILRNAEQHMRSLPLSLPTKETLRSLGLSVLTQAANFEAEVRKVGILISSKMEGQLLIEEWDTHLILIAWGIVLKTGLFLDALHDTQRSSPLTKHTTDDQDDRMFSWFQEPLSCVTPTTKSEQSSLSGTLAISRSANNTEGSHGVNKTPTSPKAPQDGERLTIQSRSSRNNLTEQEAPVDARHQRPLDAIITFRPVLNDGNDGDVNLPGHGATVLLSPTKFLPNCSPESIESSVRATPTCSNITGHSTKHKDCSPGKEPETSATFGHRDEPDDLNLPFHSEAESTGVSLSGLVKYILNCDSKSERERFISAFFLTSDLFCTPAEFLDTLIDQFELAQYLHKPDSNRIRFLICHLLKTWLESYWSVGTGDRVLGSILLFLQLQVSLFLPRSAYLLSEIAERIKSSEIKNSNAHSAPEKVEVKPRFTVKNASFAGDPDRFTFYKSTHQLSVLDICHGYLACQITAKQMKLFCTIQPKELLFNRWTTDQAMAPNVTSMSRLTNAIANWVKEVILAEINPRSRGRMIEQWILIAHQLFQLRNFDGLVAVVSGLNDTSIHRLRDSWNAVSPMTQESLRSLEKIVDPSQNYKALRAMFEGSPKLCLPFLGTYLTELVFADGRCKGDKNERRRSTKNGAENTDKVINWRKYTRIAAILIRLVESRDPFPIIQDLELQKGIDEQLSRLVGEDQDCLQDVYYRRSVFLEPRVNTRKRNAGILSLLKRISI